MWAPTVEKLNNGTYLMAYAIPMAGNPSRRCIGMATATKPTGPFFDTSSEPIACSDDPTGAIDPDLFKDSDGKVYLYWKNEGNGLNRTRVHVRELDPNTGTRFAAGSREEGNLLETLPVRSGAERSYKWFETWEQPLIENPSKVKWQNKYYLFYAGSNWETLNYRTGYAECSGPMGPCKRVNHTPILTTDASWGIGGPGGASAFVDTSGKLRLAYAAWRHDRALYDDGAPGRECRKREVFFENSSGCTSNQRFLHIATVERYGRDGLLAVPRKSEFAWAAASTPQVKSFTASAGSSFSSEINWLAAVGVSTGYPDGAFKPSPPAVERGAMAAFLYRLAGSPAYTAPAQYRSRDVSTHHPFYKEISWLAERGITTGWNDNTFRPDNPVNRDAMAAYFYRMAGSPNHTPAAVSPFRDIGNGDQFYKEVSWLASTQITTGWSDHTFRPTHSVNRETMAAFMYRMTQKSPLIAHS